MGTINSADYGLVIKNDLAEIIKSHYGQEIDPASISNHLDIIKQYNLDSIVIMELLVTLEKRFDIQIEDDELSSELVRTINTAVIYIQSKKR
ncbi:acyl carrier protein [Brevibacillus laterosporus]|uniref:acyl carrier protein n=1 Tax=Brevibacillus laterosporus TaxID=1465 RepID=UPI002652EF45|nr:phosphopantetheine-binding protein [Brevibacillus laterosporus]MDN9009020.1 phosphopantetheine-binding protein [Brevibacillus laterosporus]MDO0943601.1 phosphopantetheine-binding protein [Brevibacillus laterosporus]